jgi:hypothetical protein
MSTRRLAWLPSALFACSVACSGSDFQAGDSTADGGPEGSSTGSAGSQGPGAGGSNNNGGSSTGSGGSQGPGAGGSNNSGGAGGGGGDADAGRTDCVVQLPPPDKTWPAWGQRDNCAVCFPETCQWRGYSGGSFIDPCGIRRQCGPMPQSFGQSMSCPVDKATLWSVGAETSEVRFANPDSRCVVVTSGTPGQPGYRYFACCPSNVTQLVPPDTGAALTPLDIVRDTSCPSPTTYYLDHDSDHIGGPISVKSCYPPNPILYDRDNLATGLWVTTTGDCNDGDANVFPGQTTSAVAAYKASWLPVPLYDYNCNGVEEGPTALWVSVQDNCKLSANGQSCEGGGSTPIGGRSQSGYPGINDFCGSGWHVCAVSVHQCIDGNIGGVVACL